MLVGVRKSVLLNRNQQSLQSAHCCNLEMQFRIRIQKISIPRMSETLLLRFIYNRKIVLTENRSFNTIKVFPVPHVPCWIVKCALYCIVHCPLLLLWWLLAHGTWKRSYFYHHLADWNVNPSHGKSAKISDERLLDSFPAYTWALGRIFLITRQIYRCNGRFGCCGQQKCVRATLRSAGKFGWSRPRDPGRGPGGEAFVTPNIWAETPSEPR